FEIALQTRLEEAERRLEELEGRNAREELDEEPMSRESEFDEEEAEWAPLPEEEAENWPNGAEWASLPDDEDEELETSEAPMETSGDEEPEEAFRELVLRSRTITIPVPATQGRLVAASPEDFRPADLGDLPEQLRNELQVPRAEPYTVVRGEESNDIGNVWHLQQAVRNNKRVAHSRFENAQAGWLLYPLRALPPVATAVHGCTENCSVGAAQSRLVPEIKCSRDERKTGEASSTSSCGERRGLTSPLHSR
ncbi:unnamed protein product, partial [Acanthocheilonema viteae]